MSYALELIFLDFLTSSSYFKVWISLLKRVFKLIKFLFDFFPYILINVLSILLTKSLKWVRYYIDWFYFLPRKLVPIHFIQPTSK